MQILIIVNISKNIIKREKATPGHFSHGKYIHQTYSPPDPLQSCPHPNLSYTKKENRILLLSLLLFLLNIVTECDNLLSSTKCLLTQFSYSKLQMNSLDPKMNAT